jgi:putative transcriptional regulator
MGKLCEDLLESVQQMDDIHRRQNSREFSVDALQVKAIRKATGLIQAKSLP